MDGKYGVCRTDRLPSFESHEAESVQERKMLREVVGLLCHKLHGDMCKPADQYS